MKCHTKVLKHLLLPSKKKVAAKKKVVLKKLASNQSNKM